MREFPSLTGIRAIAAYMVFVHHYFGTNCAGKFWCPVVLELHSGVAIFFVLSGFLITWRYYQASSLSFEWLKNYFTSRIARIYPLFFLVTVLSLIILKSNSSEGILTLSFLKGFFSDYKFIVISQTWTLTVEMVFYFLAPFIFVLAKRRASLTLQFLLIFLIGLLITTGGEIDDPANFITSHIFLLSYTFFGRSFEFLVGILLALFILKRPLQTETKKITYLGLTGLILTIMLISSLQSAEYLLGIFSPQGLLVHNLILPIFIASLFLGLIQEETILSRFLCTPLMNLLGKSSYAFYLIHLGVLANLIPSFFKYNMLTFFITLNILSIGLYFFIEKPANLGIKKLSRSVKINSLTKVRPELT